MSAEPGGHTHVGKTPGLLSKSEREGRRRRLRAALAVTATFLLVEVVGAVVSGSLALLADAAHMFTDVAALLMAFAAMTLADRSATKRYTFGFYRAEILAAFVNAQLLLLIAAYILYEAYSRFTQPSEIETGIMLGVALAGLFANLTSVRLLHGHQHENLNFKAAYLEVLTDTVGSAAVIVAAVVISATGWLWIDPLISVAIACFIVPRTIRILRQAAHVLLEGTPRHIDLAALRRELSAIPGVEEIHDFHFWTLTSGVDCASVHVRTSPETERFVVRRAVERTLSAATGIDHVTVQVEELSEETCGSAHAHG
jgi:cobalt-zinc-cadmium efflux system protein